MAETYRVQVLTNTYVPELGGSYADAQYLIVPMNMTLGQVEATYGDSIRAEESKRIAARIEEKNNPPMVKELSKEELIAIKAEYLAQAEAQINELDEKIALAKDAKDIEGGK